MLERGDLVLASVSGGPDSVCLLETLLRLRRLFGVRVEVFHYDHRLREDSTADAIYVRRLAERHRVPFHLRSATDGPPRGASIEAWATVARGSAANDVRREIGAASIAEGHTLDDQVETVLLNLIRGGGLEAIAGLYPGDARSTVFVQPLLDVERGEVESFCRALHLRPRRDPSNADTTLLRNAIRLEVIPAIELATHRDPRRPIARSASLLREIRGELAETTARAFADVVTRVGSETRIDVAGLRGLSPAIASRVVRLAIFGVLSTDAIAPWSTADVRAVLDLAGGRPGRRRDLSNGLLAERGRVYLSLSSRTSPESRV